MTMLPMDPGSLFRPADIAPPQIPQIKRGGMFGGGGKFGFKEALAFGLAGFMARRNPALLQGLMGMMLQKNADQREDRQYEQHRQDALADYGAKQQIEAQYRAPEYGEFERALIESGVQPGTPGWTEAMKTRAGNMLDPVVSTIQGPMLRSMVMGALPKAPVGKLTPIEGGPGLVGPVTFPRPY